MSWRKSPSVVWVFLVALVLAAPGLGTVSAAQPPSTEPTLVQSQDAAASVYIIRANIVDVAPSQVVAGGPFTVTLDVFPEGRISPSELMSRLHVFIDSVEAPQQPLRAGPHSSASNGHVFGPASPSARGEPLRLTLSVRAPEGLQRGRPLALSIYSEMDRRLIASTQVLSEPAWYQFRSGWQIGGVAALLGFLAITSGAVILRVKRRRLERETAIAQKRIVELESTVQVERRRVSELGRPQGSPSAKKPAEAGGVPPTLPPELMQAMVRGELVVVLGAGASAQAGLPTSRTLWLNVLDRHAKRVPNEMFERVQSLVATGSSESAAELVVSLLGRDTVLEALLAELVGSRLPSPFHELLAKLPLPAVVDMTWDDLMSRALAGATPAEFFPSRHEGIAETLRDGRLALVKPLGDLRHSDSVALTQREYRLALSKAPELERSLAALFTTRTLLFFGFSLDGLEQFLGSLPPQLNDVESRHYAVMPTETDVADLWQAGLGRRFGVQLLEFRPSTDFREVVTVAEELAAYAAHSAAVARVSGTRVAPAAVQLKYVQLSSIGVFRNLRVEFEPGWTLLLGNNGCGKSTILRAVVLALAGNDPRASAAATRLLRSGADHGTVELGIGSSRIVSTLVRDGPKVVLNSPQTTLLQAGQLLVLAFPALRGVSTAQVRGPTTAPAADPSVDDVAPLLQGVVDSRLDNLQQWVVNITLRAEGDPKGREASMLKTFQNLIADMVPGGGLTLSHVDRQTWQVMMKSEGGDVRFDSVSQGMSAILNWIGILLQRLYDVYARSVAPENEAAIVLIDEIDAHLHPEWQRRLVTLTREHFPNVQIIASSHSPLLAGAVSRAELRVVVRDTASGDIQAERPREDMSGQKAEDILVSSLFSLQTTRSLEAEQTIREYFRLFQKLELGDLERARLDDLSAQLQSLNFGPTRRDSKALQEADANAEKALSETSRESLQALQQRLGALASRATGVGSES